MVHHVYVELLSRMVLLSQGCLSSQQHAECITGTDLLRKVSVLPH